MVREEKHALRGSLTIEAAYITFFSILMVVAIMMISFYMHDLAVIKADTSYLAELALRSSHKSIDITTKKLKVEQELRQVFHEDSNQLFAGNMSDLSGRGKAMIQSKMIYTKIQNVDIQWQHSNILKRSTCTVNLYGSLQFPVNIFGTSKFDIQEHCEMSEYDAIRFLWFKTLLSREKT